MGVLGLALLVGPGTGKSLAATTSVSAGRLVDVAGPRLAGERAVWVERGAQRSLRLKAADLPGLARPKQLLSARIGNQSADWFDALVAASPGLVAFRTTELVSGLGIDTTFDSPTRGVFRGGVRTFAPACSPADSCAPFALDVDGDRFVTTGPVPNQVTLGNAATGASQQVHIGGSNVRLAGRYLAWVSAAGQAVIYDHLTGREAYRVSGVAVAGQSLDVQADGKVVFTVADGSRSRLAWASPESPRPHVLPLAARDDAYTALIADDRIVFARAAHGEKDGELGEVGLSGTARILVRPAVASERGERLYDFDGRRLIWAERTCNGQRIAVAPVAELRTKPRVRKLACPLKLNQRVVLANRRSLGVDFTCSGFRPGCFTNRLYVLAAHSYRLGGRRIARGTELTQPLLAGGDRSNPTYVRLTRTGRRLLLSRRNVQVKVVATPFDSGYGGTFKQTRSVVTTVRTGR